MTISKAGTAMCAPLAAPLSLLTWMSLPPAITQTASGSIRTSYKKLLNNPGLDPGLKTESVESIQRRRSFLFDKGQIEN
jgi:hypothetical protein